jgi:HPt (histidine-containing phosphotransfer) domain-containing protein
MALLDEIVEMLPTLLDSMRQAIAAGDGAGLQSAARTLLDSIRYLGAEAPMNLAFELERMGRDDRLQEARALFPAFAEAMDRMLKACVEYVHERRSAGPT